MIPRKVLFLDRDGTLIEEPNGEQIDSYEKFQLMPDIIPALRQLQAHDYHFVMITNQDGLGTPFFPHPTFDGPHQLLLRLFASQGITFDAIYICPHLPADQCTCRKPSPALLAPYLAQHAIDRTASAVIGDRVTDLELAAHLGIPGLRCGPEGMTWPALVTHLLTSAHTATVERRTNETTIRVTLACQRSGAHQIHTGIGFFDHMLAQIALHAQCDLTVTATGDLQIDEHHTVEDVGLCLGEALRLALGSKRQISRYGFVLPMDESLAHVVLDCSGRPGFHFTGTFPRDRVGELPTELVPHFFSSLAMAAHCTLHMQVTGTNAHHMVEALFKGFGRALRQATSLATNGECAAIPSTKGAL